MKPILCDKLKYLRFFAYLFSVFEESVTWGMCLSFPESTAHFKMNLKYELTVDENCVSVTCSDYDLAR